MTISGVRFFFSFFPFVFREGKGQDCENCPHTLVPSAISALVRYFEYCPEP